MDLLCLDFMNSEFRDFRGRWFRDDLRQPGWLSQFLDKWHLHVAQSCDEAVLAELSELRALLIRVVKTLNSAAGVDANDLEMLNTRLRKSAFSSQIEHIDQEFHLTSVPLRQDWDWVQSEIITDFVTLLADYDPQRLKVCQNPNCRWIFYDETKSRTRRYCTTNKCANLMKLRRFRERHKENAS